MTYTQLPGNLDDELRAQLYRLEMDERKRLNDILAEIQLLEAHRKATTNPRHDMCQFYLDQARKESEEASENVQNESEPVPREGKDIHPGNL